MATNRMLKAKMCGGQERRFSSSGRISWAREKTVYLCAVCVCQRTVFNHVYCSNSRSKTRQFIKNKLLLLQFWRLQTNIKVAADVMSAQDCPLLLRWCLLIQPPKWKCYVPPTPVEEIEENEHILSSLCLWFPSPFSSAPPS